jgi:hypothetical protein
MKRGNRGSGLIVGIIALVVVAAIVFYFISDPFKAKVNEQVRQATKWTPENIQKDPVGYLQWALDECNSSKDMLEAREIGLRSQLKKFEMAHQEKSAQLANDTKLVEEAKDAYTKASGGGGWPVEFRGRNIDEATMKRLIVEGARRRDQFAKQVDTYAMARGKVEKKLAQVQKMLDDVRLLRTKLESDIEIAKVNKTVDGIEGITDQLTDIISTSHALAAQESDMNLLDELSTPTADQALEDDFTAIMGE